MYLDVHPDLGGPCLFEQRTEEGGRERGGRVVHGMKHVDIEIRLATSVRSRNETDGGH